MSYEKVNWANEGDANETDISAENLGHMDEGIYNLQNVELIAITDTAPATCATGDKYFNTTTNKVYTATAENTWGAAGVDAVRKIFYIDTNTHEIYYYNGTTLIKASNESQNITTGVEFATNEYIDGNRVYGRKINIGNLANAGRIIVDITIDNVNTIVKFQGTATKASGDDTADIHSIVSLILYRKSSGKLFVDTTIDGSAYTAYITIYYTKN